MGDGVALPENVIAFPGVTADEIARARKGLGSVVVRHAGTIADGLGERLAGFIVIGVADDGSYNIGYRAPRSMCPMLFHSLISEIMRREVVVTNEVNYLLKRRHLIEDDE